MQHVKQSVKHAAALVQRLWGCPRNTAGETNPFLLAGLVLVMHMHQHCSWPATEIEHRSFGVGGSRYSCLNVLFMLKCVQNRNCQFKHKHASNEQNEINSTDTPVTASAIIKLKMLHRTDYGHHTLVIYFMLSTRSMMPSQLYSLHTLEWDDKLTRIS